MLFYNQLEIILPNFTEVEKSYIRDMVDFNSHDLNSEEEFILLKIIRSIDENTVQDKKDFLIDIFEQVYVRRSIPSMFIVNGGEDLVLTVKLRKNQDLTGSYITIRQDDGTLLSPNNVAGTADSTQTISITDIALTTGSFYKLRVLSEAPTGTNVASGDVLTILDTFYLYVADNVDTV